MIEIKLSDTPTLWRGNHEAIAAIEPIHTFIVTPVARASGRRDGLSVQRLEGMLGELTGLVAGLE